MNNKYTYEGKLNSTKDLVLYKVNSFALKKMSEYNNKEKGNIYYDRSSQEIRYKVVSFDLIEYEDSIPVSKINKILKDKRNKKKEEDIIISEILKCHKTLNYDNEVYHGVNIIRAYLKAAEEILVSIRCANQLNSSHDELTLPTLLLYVHAVELSLKLLAKKLILHSHEKNICGYNLETEIEDKLLVNHDIRGMYSWLKKILPKNDSIHFFKIFDKINDIIKLYDDGMTSITLRYQYHANGNIPDIFKEKVNIKINDLSKDVTKICYQVIYYVESDEFYKCESEYYSHHRLHELKECIKILKQYSKNYQEIKKQRIKEKEENSKYYNEFGGTSFTSLPLDYFDRKPISFDIYFGKIPDNHLFNLYRAHMFVSRNEFELEEHFYHNKQYFMDKCIALDYNKTLEKLSKEVIKIQDILNKVKK